MSFVLQLTSKDSTRIAVFYAFITIFTVNCVSRNVHNLVPSSLWQQIVPPHAHNFVKTKAITQCLNYLAKVLLMPAEPMPLLQS